VTYDEFCVIVPDGQKADLIDGIVYVAPPDLMHLNKLNGFLVILMDGYVGAKRIGGEVFMCRVACRFSQFDAPEPDILYVRPNSVHRIEPGQLDGPPDIAVEIVDDESRQRDTVLKRELYRSNGVTEYWIIDPLQQQCEFLRLVSGKYEPIALEQGHIFRSSVIPGFWLDVNWLLGPQIPAAYECLKIVLA